MFLLVVSIIAMDFSTRLELDLTQFEIFEGEAFGVSRNGQTIVICDSDSGNLVFLKGNGELVKRVAQKGQGPGEFQIPGWIEWFESEQVFRVADYGNLRFSSWNSKGELVEELPWFKGRGFMFKELGPHQILFSRDLAGHFEGRPTLAAYDLKTGECREIWEYPLGKQMQVTAADLPNDGGRIARLLRWDPRLSYGVGDDFIAVTWGEDPKISLIDLNGKSLGRDFPVELPQYPITKEQIDSQVMEFNERFRSLLAKNMVLREYWPVTSQIIVDDANRIWAFSFQKEEGEPYSFRVFDRHGKCLGDGEIEQIPDVIQANRLYYISDSDDESVLLKRVDFEF